jgi:hypothetical protein
MKSNDKRLLGIMTAVTVILCIPFVAMFFTDEVNWTSSDFVIAGILLYGTGGIIELVLRNVKKVKSRIVVCSIILLVLMLIWAELAVGIFGTPLSGS